MLWNGKLSGTLPLAAAWNAARGGAGREPKLGEVARFATRILDINDQRLNVSPPDINAFATKVKALNLPPPPPPLPAPSREFIELWGYTASGSYNEVNDFSCLVDEVDNDEFARMLVLSSVEFGDSEERTSGDFQPNVTVHFNNQRIELPLGKESYLNSFVTNGTWTSGAGDDLWRNKLKFDPSFVHVFLFDLVRDDDGKYKADPVDPTALAPYYKALDALEAAKANLEAGDVDAGEVLFTDDLWTPQPSSQAPNGSVPSVVVIGTVIARIVVTCSVTVSRWDDQAAAGRATGEGLIFPHIMIASTTELDRASGGVRLTRPSQFHMLDMLMSSSPMRKLTQFDIPTTMMEYMHAADANGDPFHMTKDIDAVLITDSNDDVMTVGGQVGPFIVWSNLFNYYIDEPTKKLGGSVIKVVDHKRTQQLSFADSFGFVERDTSDVFPFPSGILNSFKFFPEQRVSKYERQGAFDSIHMAPKMKIPEGLIDSILPANVVGISGETLTSADFAQLKMDRISMAPFCPHDCFHMHWRWTDNLNGSQIATRGWGNDKPNEVPGAPMVRHNQDVYVGLPTPHTILYLADIHGVPSDDWQVICHHGAFYALTSSNLVGLAQTEVDTRLHGVFFSGSHRQGRPIPDTYWPLFYWRLRYKVILDNGRLVLQERMRFLQGWKKAANR
jgi:hypothetical protein